MCISKSDLGGDGKLYIDTTCIVVLNYDESMNQQECKRFGSYAHSRTYVHMYFKTEEPS